MNSNTRTLVTLSPYLKEKLVQKAKEYGCSQAEVVRIALIRLMEANG
ncbi:ribbon-helix-helix domain-containing protein [Methanohalophilus sp.]